MRKPTHSDAELLLRLYEVRREPELREARKWFLTAFAAESWEDIKTHYLSHSDEDRWFRMTTSYWEMVGTLVNAGVLHAGLFFDHTGEDIVTWARCRGWIDGARRDIRPTYLHQFERLVKEHEAHRARGIAALQASQARRERPKRSRVKARSARTSRRRR